MNKRLKMRVNDFNSIGIGYYDFYRVKDSSNNRGTRFILCQKLTEEQINKVKGFKNTLISGGVHRYAPEITNQSIILLDKCIKN